MKIHAVAFPRDPLIPTEDTMFRRLMASGALGDEYTLCTLPLAHMINVLGVPSTQSRIDAVRVPGKKLFVCQHVLTDKLMFDSDSIVATPHATWETPKISIPHFPVTIDPACVKGNRSMRFSFVGSVQTHPVRKVLARLYPRNCFDSGRLWGLGKRIPNRWRFRKKYVGMLGDSDFSLCPRGTGCSSVRLFESMAMGAIPVIIADGYRPPLHSLIDWSACSVMVALEEVARIHEILDGISAENVRSMRERMENVYRNYLCPARFEKSIEMVLCPEIQGKFLVH